MYVDGLCVSKVFIYSRIQSPIFTLFAQQIRWPLCVHHDLLLAARICWCAILIAHQIVMAKHGGSCVHFSGISTCGRTSRETVSHSQRQPLPNPHKIALPVYVTVTNKRLQPLTTTLYNSLMLSFSLLTTKQRLIKHRVFCAYCVVLSSADGARLFHVPCRPASRGVEQTKTDCRSRFKLKYFIASHTCQGVPRCLCNKVSHTHTHTNT